MNFQQLNIEENIEETNEEKIIIILWSLHKVIIHKVDQLYTFTGPIVLSLAQLLRNTHDKFKQ